MKREKTTIRRRHQPKHAISESGRMKLISLMAVCFIAVASVFFYTARQHFSSVDYGMRNSKLRKQLDDLEAEKRRLLLAREISLSPAEIRKAVKKLGIGEFETDSIELASAARETKLISPQGQPTVKITDPGTGYVVRTAFVASTAIPRSADVAKIDERNRDKKVRAQIAPLIASR